MDNKSNSGGINIGDQLLAALPGFGTPKQHDPRVDQANALVGKRRYDDAAALYREVLQSDAKNADALGGLAALFNLLNLPEKALPLLERLAEEKPLSAATQSQIGKTLTQLDRLDEALAAAEKAVNLKPQDARTHYNFGNALRRLERHQASAAAYQRAIELDPGFLSALNNLGCAQIASGDDALAIKALQRAVDAKPRYAEAWYNLGRAMVRAGRQEEGYRAFDQAISLKPRDGVTWRGVGLGYKEAGDYTKAIDYLRMAIKFLSADPNAIKNPLEPLNGDEDPLATAHHALATCLLVTGQLEDGWNEHTWRYRATVRLAKRLPRPVWDGKRLDNKILRVNWEQGLGDTIQFVRFLSFAKLRGPKILFECQQPLKGLFDDLPGVDWLVGSEDETKPDIRHDAGTTLMELPRLLNIDMETVPASVPYIYAPGDAVRRIKSKIRAKGVKVGLVWSGSDLHPRDAERSIDLEELEPLLDIEGATFFSLQYGRRADDVKDLPKGMKPKRLDYHIDSFEDLAAALSQMDLLISVDSAPVHLAGAMGRSAWVMLPFEPDWRWLLEKKNTPWYPTVHLYRQTKTRTWGSVVEAIRDDLEKFVRASRKKRRP